ncbi:excinuclease ABC subunit UvrC [Tersicoccus sp. Bi-70]|uniref:excinuclease ABC subunit UvrC n=1 Tax=Tersicoccus sp. Bi-70 TaxID=1897634 RepID=UPI000975E55D|nr:excinuclease ABC subunit UvrC [Tersicoccus sp. Bi-70]OMH33075.1 excinuclease ABC subunit C [Tersicoccus sp. Bi-70]
MADPRTYRPKTGEIPTTPGVYRFRDQHGRVIYVGKAKNLRSRLNSYFASPRTLLPKTRTMVFSASSVEWTVVGSEFEALQLEYTWIKEYDPRFNIAFKDDKSYPYLAITMGEEFPRVQVMRGDKQKGTRYFGPYSQAWAIRDTVDTLLRVFPMRSCSGGVFRRAKQAGRPCLLGYIGKCSAPCVGRVTPEEHRDIAQEFCDFMAGKQQPFITELEKKMHAAVAELDYERAATLRDDIGALTKAFTKNAVVLKESVDADVFGIAQDELEAAVQVFHVRGGRIRGQRGWVVEKVDDSDDAELIEQLLQQVYGDATRENERIPRQVLVPELPADLEDVTSWLSGLRGSHVAVSVPKRGDKAALADTVRENAVQSLRLHKSRRAGDLTTRSAALQELQDALELTDSPLRIECYDISHVQGTNVVASMVVFEDGLAKKSDYRKFGINGDAARDDTAAMYDVIHRRFRNYLTEQAERAASGPVPRGGAGVDPVHGGARPKFAYPPNLVVVDGGPPQVAAAGRALADLGITDIDVVGLAKRLEEVWVPDSEFPVILPRASHGLFLLQRVRDEAHRFAITFHRQRRSAAMTASELDDVPGLGPVKRKALLKAFGSVKKLRAADLAELTAVPGVGQALAISVMRTLGSPSLTEGESTARSGAEDAEGDGATDGGTERAAVNVSTGELLD